ncbi:MAG: hypothetical protein K6E50_02585 [Lachnospiraceae bacterium]|nr:hypothetical protein [Lachnospiraceae bacterium]
MRSLRLLPGEFMRLLRGRLTQAVMVLTLVSPILGIFFYKPVLTQTMQSVYVANPAIAGGLAGYLLFGLLTILECGRIAKTRVNLLTDSLIPPELMAAVRFSALVLTALLTLTVTATAWLPISRCFVGSVFAFEDHFASYLLFMGTSLLFGMLIAASAYYVSGSTELSVIVLLCGAALNLTAWADKWQLCFITPMVDALSDDFSNHRVFLSVAWMKLSWLLLLGGIFILSGLCIRKYGKTLAASFLLGAKKLVKPAAALLLLGCAAFTYLRQPMTDNSNADLDVLSFCEIPYLEDVLCTGLDAKIVPDVDRGTLSGECVYRFLNLSGEERTLLFGITPGYRIRKALANGTEVLHVLDDYQEFNVQKLELTIPADEETQLVLSYAGFPKENRNISDLQGEREISRRYICLENANIAPDLLNVTTDPESFARVCEVVLPASMTPVSFEEGREELVSENPDGTKTWRYEGDTVNSILYAGDYVKEEVETDAGTVNFYYGAKHKAVMDEIKLRDVVKTVMDYCTEHYGTPQSISEGYVKLVESRIVHGGYATPGASLMDEADFTAFNLKDPSKGAGGSEVMIHELVHQWWGLGIMFSDMFFDETQGPWSSEGLTVYSSYRIAKELYGEEYAQKNYIDLWKDNLESYQKNFYIRNPEYLDRLSEDERSSIVCGLSDLRRYDEMPLKLLKAEELVGGEEAFDEILYELFNRELDPENPFLTYADFLDACGLREEDLDLE